MKTCAAEVPFSELPAGEDYVRVKVDYSGVNYKDGHWPQSFRLRNVRK